MRYRLVVADLDGTLMGDDAVISPAVLAAAEKAMARGLLFTIATGRTWQGARPHALQLGVNAPAILYQGGEIRDMATGAALYQSAISLDCAREFIAVIAAAGLHLNVYLDDQAYTAALSPILDYYTTLNRVEVRAVGDLLTFVDRPPSKLLIVAEAERLDRLAPALRRQFDGRLQIVRSHRNFLEAIPPEANKGRGLERLAAYLGVPQPATVAIGDNDNDAEMVAWAGLGIAMGNASAAVRAVAGAVAPSVDYDGAAWAIETLVLGSCQQSAISGQLSAVSRQRSINEG